MKVKQQPEDFFVEELTTAQPGTDGEFSFYRLEKKGWTTPDAVQIISRRWKLKLQRISFGGLKDRHAYTVQYLTIHHGPKRPLTHQGIKLKFQGCLSQPYTSRDFTANSFGLTVRSLSEQTVEHASQALAEVREAGLPNYFDDQRFGSVSAGQFAAKELVKGNFEVALRLALVASYEHDRAAQKQEKAILRSHWGDWAVCKAKLPYGHASSIVDFLLHHRDDFRGAIARLRPELHGLYMSAYQSHLWNRMLAKWLRDKLPAEQLLTVHLRMGPAPMQRRLTQSQLAELRALQLPLPTARGTADPSDKRTALMQAILDEEGLKREQLKVSGLREVFFSRGERPALCMPIELKHTSAGDELNPGRQKLQLNFDLPRGSYATLIVKRAVAGGPDRTIET